MKCCEYKYNCRPGVQLSVVSRLGITIRPKGGGGEGGGVLPEKLEREVTNISGNTFAHIHTITTTNTLDIFKIEVYLYWLHCT